MKSVGEYCIEEMGKRGLAQGMQSEQAVKGHGMVEASIVVEVDFTSGPTVITPEEEVSAFLDTLAREVRTRNPVLAGQ